MIKFFKQICFLVLFCMIVLHGKVLFGQDHTVHSHTWQDHPVLSAIDQEAQTGQISKEEALIQSLYAGLEPERLDSRFRIEGSSPIKCLTPVIMEYERIKEELSPAGVAKIEKMLSLSAESSIATHSHTSPSGNFILYYETEGSDAVPLEDIDNSGVPDYVEKAAFAADSSYRYEVTEMGFRDFLKSEPYEIYFQNFGLYGKADASGSTTYITIHKDFESGFPENTHPEGNQTGAIYATIAHEIKHAIQYATNRWKGEAGTAGWAEMDATLMEEVVFDDVNDYYNYIKTSIDSSNPNGASIFGSPNSPIPGSYNHISWALYFHETYGPDFWVDVWEIIGEDYLKKKDQNGDCEDCIPFLDAVDIVLQSYNSSFPQAHLQNHIWHMLAGPDFNTPDFGFEEREEYPSSKFLLGTIQPSDSLTNKYIIARAANYVQVQPSNITPGQPTLLIDSQVEGVGIGVVAFFRNGDIDVQYIVDPNSTSQSLQTTWSWENIVDMRIAVVNTNLENSGTYDLTLTSIIPDQDTITQNYPNPFNPTTTIGFSLSESKRVKIEVYDRIGRKVSTLIDDQLNRGFHTVPFDGSALASGVYFYRIITDQTITTKKMVLVK